MTPTHCPSCGHDPIRIISMTDMMKRPNAVNANMFLASGALGYLECEKCENENSTRAGKWRRFDKNRELRSGHTLPPAFIQSTADGLWAVQNLCTPPLVTYGKFTRLCQDPPLCDPSEPYYSGWPGDHRGWMRFASLVEARDYYLFATQRITMAEYHERTTARAGPRHPSRRYAIDDAGEFIEHPHYDKPPETI